MKSLSVFTFILTSIIGCASTTHFSKEYSTAYVLRDDTMIGHCPIFTGAYSLYFGGPENVLCLGKGPGIDILKSGSKVKVNRLYQIGGVNSAELSIVDTRTGKSTTVYLHSWEDKKSYLKVP